MFPKKKKKMDVVESTVHLNADIPTPFVLPELLNQSFNFSKSLFIYKFERNMSIHEPL